MELITSDRVLIKVDTKHCLHCNHHYQDHFTDGLKYPNPRRCVRGCGMQLCCYGKCKCGEYIPTITNVLYESKTDLEHYEPHEYIRFDHCDECKVIDYKDRTERAAKHPNYSLPDFATRYEGIPSGDNYGYESDRELLPYQRIKENSTSTKYEPSNIPISEIPLETWHGRVKEASKLTIQDL